MNTKNMLNTIAFGSLVAMSSAAMAGDNNPFAAKCMEKGYENVAECKKAEGKCGEGKCGGDSTAPKKAEGKCGEGKCGGDSTAPKKAEGKCGEGKCGGSN